MKLYILLILIIIIIIIFRLVQLYYYNKFCRIQFIDFYNGFNPSNNIIVKILNKYNIKYKIVDDEPDFVIYSVFGDKHIKLKINLNMSKFIFYTGESIFDNNNADVVIGFLPNNINNIKNKKYINFCYYGDEYFYNTNLTNVYSILNDNHILNRNLLNKDKKKFCCIIVSNGSCEERNLFYDMLSEYKQIDSMGKYRNNISINIPPRGTLEYYKLISQYKFIICFENISKKYYITEKLWNAMRSAVIPIYWGDTNCGENFNKESFIYVENYNNYNMMIKEFNRVIDYIKILDNNDDMYYELLNEPYVLDAFNKDKKFEEQVNNIANIFHK